MSQITDVVVTTGIDDKGIESLQAFLANDDMPLLKGVSEHSLGGKVMCTGVFIGAYNYLDCQGFKDAFLAAPWEYPESAVLVIYEDERDEPTIARPTQ